MPTALRDHLRERDLERLGVEAEISAVGPDELEVRLRPSDLDALIESRQRARSYW